MCEAARDTLKAEFPEVTALRDVSIDILESVKGTLSENAYKRARHICEENNRVLLAQELLSENKLYEFGQLLFDSHQSSIDNFENSCGKLDFLIEAARKSEFCLGARLSGGGFGGISIHLIKAEDTNKYLDYIKATFKESYNIVPDTFLCHSAAGATAWNYK